MSAALVFKTRCHVTGYQDLRSLFQPGIDIATSVQDLRASHGTAQGSPALLPTKLRSTTGRKTPVKRLRYPSISPFDSTVLNDKRRRFSRVGRQAGFAMASSHHALFTVDAVVATSFNHCFQLRILPWNISLFELQGLFDPVEAGAFSSSNGMRVDMGVEGGGGDEDEDKMFRDASIMTTV